MVFGATEILICIVPVFLIILVVGIALFFKNRSAGSDKERK